jgi:hypothetical protein
MDNFKKVANVTTGIVFIVAFLLGYGTSSRIVNRDRTIAPESKEAAQSATGKEPSPAETILAPVADEADSIRADDQPAGGEASVTVSTQKGAWVAIHEDTEGKPGAILGAQFFAAGQHTRAVTLLRATEAGKKYYAMMHSDDGDRVFDHTADMPLKNAAGEIVMHAFMATEGPAAQ